MARWSSISDIIVLDLLSASLLSGSVPYEWMNESMIAQGTAPLHWGINTWSCHTQTVNKGKLDLCHISLWHYNKSGQAWKISFVTVNACRSITSSCISGWFQHWIVSHLGTCQLMSWTLLSSLLARLRPLSRALTKEKSIMILFVIFCLLRSHVGWCLPTCWQIISSSLHCWSLRNYDFWYFVYLSTSKRLMVRMKTIFRQDFLSDIILVPGGYVPTLEIRDSRLHPHKKVWFASTR